MALSDLLVSRGAIYGVRQRDLVRRRISCVANAPANRSFSVWRLVDSHHEGKKKKKKEELSASDARFLNAPAGSVPG